MFRRPGLLRQQRGERHIHVVATGQGKKNLDIGRLEEEGASSAAVVAAAVAENDEVVAAAPAKNANAVADAEEAIAGNGRLEQGEVV